MSFELTIENEYLMELIYGDKTLFLGNLKTLKLNAWLLLRIQRIGT